MTVEILSIIAFLCLVGLVVGRGFMLRARGINAFLFGATDKSDFILVVPVLFLIYTVLSCVFGLPMPAVLSKSFFGDDFLRWVGLAVCAFALIWFAMTLRSFGESFRVGIDEKAPDKLITDGMFAISRNPIYVAFLFFITGIFLIYPIRAVLIFAVLMVAAIQRQIVREEKFLIIHYGMEYKAYCKKVRRYL